MKTRMLPPQKRCAGRLLGGDIVDQLVLDELKSSYEATIAGLRVALAKIRTGRANLNMLDSVRVDYYGQPTPLAQVATMKVADPRLITLLPWEKGIIQDIERAISASDLGLNPSNDGNIIRVPIPALTGERRQDLVRMARREAEDHKISLRNIRRHAKPQPKAPEKDSQITEDQLHRAFTKVDALTEKYSNLIDEIVAAKETDISEI